MIEERRLAKRKNKNKNKNKTKYIGTYIAR